MPPPAQRPRPIPPPVAPVAPPAPAPTGGLHLNYIGSKRTLVPTLMPHLQPFLTPDTTFIDLFAGTGSVARAVQRASPQSAIIANDLQYYAYVVNTAILARYTDAERDAIRATIATYNAAADAADPARDGFMARHYAPPARAYFTRENAVRMDVLRDRLERDRADLGPKVYTYLLAALLVAADRVANTSSVYASYLKKFKKTALRPLVLTDELPPAPATADGPDGPPALVHHGDAATLADLLPDNAHAVVYMDPPYNGRQYAVYYHILETLALADRPALHGVTGMRDQNNLSDFCSKVRAPAAFRDLFARLRKFPTVLLSYNDEGIVPVPTLVQLLETAYGGAVTIHTIPYKKFKAQQRVQRKTVNEYLIVARRPPDARE